MTKIQMALLLIVAFSFSKNKIWGKELNSNLEISSPDISKNILLLTTNTGFNCSSFIVKAHRDKRCGASSMDNSIQSYRLLSANHCVQAAAGEFNNEGQPLDDATQITVSKSTSSSEFCTQTKSGKVSAFNLKFMERELKDFSATSSPKKVSPLLPRSSDLKPLIVFYRSKSKKRAQIGPPSPSSSRFKDAKSTLPRVGSSIGSQPTAVLKVDLNSTNFVSNQCVDLMQVKLDSSVIAHLDAAEIQPFELAENLPMKSETVYLMGFQYGCNPVKLACRYLDAAGRTEI